MIVMRNIDPKQVVKWFDKYGSSETIRSNPHLQQWTGKGWIMKLQYEVGVIHFNLLIEFSNEELEYAFYSSCHSHDWTGYSQANC